METGEQHSARGGLSLLLLMLGVIGCEPPQSESPDATANSVEPGALPTMTVGAGPEQDKGFLEWCQDAAAPDEVRYTVTVLLAYLETDDCVIAADSLAPRKGLISRISRSPENMVSTSTAPLPRPLH